MRRRLGRYVLEDERLLVLMDDLGGYLASDDPAEQALLQPVNYSLLGPPRQGPSAPPWPGSKGRLLDIPAFFEK